MDEFKNWIPVFAGVAIYKVIIISIMLFLEDKAKNELK